MGALGTEKVRRGEFVSKGAVFEGVVADAALDGGVVACCVFGGSGGGGGGGGRSNTSTAKNSVGGGLQRIAGTPSSLDRGAGPARSEKTGGAAAATGARSANPGNVRNRATVSSSNEDPNSDTFVCPERAATGNGGGSDRGGTTTTKNKNSNKTNTKTSSKRSKAAVLASASICATTGGSMAPAAFLPRGSTAAALRGGREAAAAADALGPGDDGDHRKSSILVWPGKLEATSGDAGLEAKVPYRLTCVRATAFEARFKGAHNALLAGTKEGLALAFDWGCLLRDSGRGAGGGSGSDGWEGGNGRPKGEVLAPSAQVTCVTNSEQAVDGRPL